MMHHGELHECDSDAPFGIPRLRLIQASHDPALGQHGTLEHRCASRFGAFTGAGDESTHLRRRCSHRRPMRSSPPSLPQRASRVSAPSTFSPLRVDEDVACRPRTWHRIPMGQASAPFYEDRCHGVAPGALAALVKRVVNAGLPPTPRDRPKRCCAAGSGMAFHWQPVESTSKMAFKTSRISTERGRPPRLAGRMNGLTSSHSVGQRSDTEALDERLLSTCAVSSHRALNHNRFIGLNNFSKGS